MQFFRRHWYSFGLVWAIIATAWALLGRLPTVQMILLLNFATLALHQFEEYGWPGGFPWIYNEVVVPSGGPADRFPLNQNSALFINVVGWGFCLVPAVFPNQLWLGLAMVLFTLGQLIYHGVVTNRKFKSLYNPGLAAVVFGHVPLGIWYLTEVYSKSTVTLRDWLLAVVYLGCFIGVVMRLIGFRILAAKDSPYPFAPEEMERFDRSGHLVRLGTPSDFV
jgi:uncharacterized protein with HXXEE motif